MNRQRQRRRLLLVWTAAVGLLLAFGASGAAASVNQPGDLTVLKGGYRDVTKDSSLDYALPLEGAAFEHDTDSAFSMPTAFPALTDAAGATTAKNLSGERHYVRETTAPKGWRLLDQLTWGGSTQPYIGSAKIDGSKTVSPRFVNAADNPPLPATCGTGLKVLLLLDTSGSTEPYRDDYTKAGKVFVDTLAGTPTQLMISSFATESHPGGTMYDLSTAAGATDANKEIDRLYGPDFDGGFTNWDAAFQDAAKAGVDVVIFVTDGNPTVHKGGSSSLENIVYGVASANLAKYPALNQTKQGQRILGVGVGGGLSVANLSAVSGPKLDEDYFTGSEAELAAKLRDIAAKLCPGTITIRKAVIAGTGTETFSMQIDDQTIGEPLGDGGETAPQSVPAGKHTVAEFGAGTTLLDEYGSEVSCEDLHNGNTRSVLGTASGTSITVEVGSNQDVVCTFTNTFDPATLTLVKQVVNDNGGTAGAADFTLAAAAQGDGDDTRNFTSATSDPVSNPVFAGVVYDLSESGPAGYAAGEWSCETTNPLPAVAQLVQVGSTVELALGEHVTCTIINDDVAPLLQLRKVVINDNGGTATTADFALSATGTIAGNSISGASPIDSGATLQADTWTLSESGPAGYTGTWVCVGGTQVDTAITVGIGGTATCTITNDDTPPAAVTPVIAPPAPVVAPPTTVRGIASVRGPQGCVPIGQVPTRVTARNVARVVFTRDGVVVKRVKGAGKGLQVFTLRTVLTPDMVGVHTVKARVTFVSGASPRLKVLTHRFALCRSLPVTG
jgi:hypothetical protein